MDNEYPLWVMIGVHSKLFEHKIGMQIRKFLSKLQTTLIECFQILLVSGTLVDLEFKKKCKKNIEISVT